MFDIISDLDDNNDVNSTTTYLPYQVEDFSFFPSLEQSAPSPTNLMDVIQSTPVLPENNLDYFETPNLPAETPGNMGEMILQPELVNPDSYIFYDSNNIGYTFDPVTQTYIPVNVNVTVQQNDLNFNGIDSIGNNGSLTMPSLNGVNYYNYYGSYYTSTGDNGMRNYYVDDENKRPKKRKRKSSVDLPSPEKLLNVKLYEDSLLALDSQSFDEYVEGAYLKKKFSEEEKDYFRDIRRRIKNRESARKSRKNKRTKLDTLSSQVQELTDETNNLRLDNNNLRQENFQLKNEVVYLQSVISNYNNSYESKTSVKPEKASSSPMSSHSIILFVILFSFGILWNLDSSIFTSSFNFQNNKHQFIAQNVKKC